MADIVSVGIIVTPRQILDETVNAINNPPQSPLDAVQRVDKLLKLGVTDFVSQYLPLPIISSAISIFNAFSFDTPSFEFQAITQVSQQVAALSNQIESVKNEIISNLSEIARANSEYTISSIVQSQSITETLKSNVAITLTKQLIEQKNEIYAAGNSEILSIRKASEQELLSKKALFEESLSQIYKLNQDKLASIGISLLKKNIPILETAANDFDELQKIQAEIDDIKSVDVVEVARILCSRYFKVDL